MTLKFCCGVFISSSNKVGNNVLDSREELLHVSKRFRITRHTCRHFILPHQPPPRDSMVFPWGVGCFGLIFQTISEYNNAEMANESLKYCKQLQTR